MKKLILLILLISQFSCNPFLTKYNTGIEKCVLERDEGLHLKNSLEWWYITGFLDGDNGIKYGIEYVFFHFCLKDGRPRYMINVAITNPDDSVFIFDHKISLSKDCLNDDLPLSFKTPNYQWNGEFGEYDLKASMTKHKAGFKLHTTPTQPVVLHQGTGYVNYGDVAKAGYYSYPKLQTNGQIFLGKDTVDVKGFTWYDRQWDCGNVTANKVSWDWTAINLSDDSELMLYKIESLKEDRRLFGGTYIDSNNKTTNLLSSDITFEPLSYWTSPNTKKSYSTKWLIKIDKLKLNLEMEALIPNQELIIPNRGKTVNYWEGMCKVKGEKSGNPITGDSYLEMTNK